MPTVDCVYCESIEDEMVACTNTTDLTHPGVVPIKFCGRCPYRTTENGNRDFFSQTARLLTKNQSIGEYRPNPKPCGGCGEPKRRKPDQPFDLQFVWPYWHGGAHGDEIRFSVRSVEKFFDGKAKCTIIGDKPPWFTGHYIPQRRVPKRTQDRPYRDMIAKVWTMATHPEIDTDFIWMMDDIYFLKPFTLEQIQTPRAERWRESDYNSWQRFKTASMKELTAAGRTNYDYATHMPHYVEKEKLVTLFEEFGLHEKTMLWEVLYKNRFNGRPSRTRPFFARIGKPMDSEHLAVVTRRSTVLNHTAGSWSEGVRNFLLALMPDSATCESDAIPHPKIKTSRARSVKRRPLETHRAYLERHQRVEATK